MRKDIYLRMLDLMHINNNTTEGIKNILKLISLPSFMDTCYEFEKETEKDKMVYRLLYNGYYYFRMEDYNKCFCMLLPAVKLGYVKAIDMANKTIEKIFEDPSKDIFSYLTEEEWEEINDKYDRYKKLKVRSLLNCRKLKDLEEQDKMVITISDKIRFTYKELLNYRVRLKNVEDNYQYAIDLFKDGRKNIGIFFLHLSAIQGHTTAKYFIGYLYEWASNIKEAMKWYKDVVELKDSMIGKSKQAYIGTILLPQKRSLSLFKEAAEEYCTKLEDKKYIKL